MPQFTLFVMGNHRPGLHGVDAAIKARIHMVPFSVFIPPNERDKDLAEKLKAEWPGILAWQIEGCLKWRSRGLAMPPVVVTATCDYFDEEDVIGAWSQDHCTDDPTRAAYTDDLWLDFQTWMTASGEPPRPKRWFISALKDRGYRHDREKRRTVPKRDKLITYGLILQNGMGTVPP